MTTEQPSSSNGIGSEERTFTIERVYLKDLSFEAPATPAVFKQQWQPNMNLQLHTSSTHIEGHLYEVVLSATITVTSTEKTAFLVETKYAGIFTISQFSDEQQKVLINSVCPSILFPYLREVVTDVVTRGSFPQLILAPVNFDALYAEHMRQQQQPQLSESDTIN